PILDPFVRRIDEEVIERDDILVDESKDEGFVDGDASDFDNVDSHMPELEFEVDMQNFKFMIDTNLESVDPLPEHYKFFKV
nr:hypothetical protein [Tanacetum cinerariifolium]